MDYISYQGNDNKNNGSRSILILAFIFILLILAPFISPQNNMARDAADATPIEDNADNTPKDIPVAVKFPVQTRTLETDQLTISMTNVGGGRPNSILIKDPDRYAQHGEFIRSQKQTDEDHADILPLAVDFPALGITRDTQFETISAPDDHKTAAFAYTTPNGNLKFVKTFSTTDKPYVIHAKFDITNLSTQNIQSDLSLTLFIKQIEGEEPGLFTPGSYVAAKCFTDDTMEYLDATDKDKEESYSKEIRWFAVDESYFAIAAAIPNAKECHLENDNGLLASHLQVPVAVDQGKTTSLEFDIYTGPKESKYLAYLGDDVELEKIIDYGWIEVLAKPMAFILDKFHQWTGNWGLAIILLTIIVRILLWPIAQKSQISMMRMSKIAPLMQELQEKYKDDQATLAQKQMELYKEQNVSPFGCLPLLLQMPIFFALYRCIFVTGGLYHASFVLWIKDLSAPDPFFVLPLISVGLLVLQQLLTPSTAKNTQQKVMMFSMPVIFGIMMLFLPAGLCLYMVVSSGFSMAQSFYVRHIIAKEDAEKQGPKVEVLNPENSSSKDRRAAKRRDG